MGGEVVIITVDNRIRVPYAELEPETIEALRVAFTHANPAHEKLKRLGFGRGRWSEPKTYTTYKLDDREMSFPLGGLRKVRQALRAMGEALHFDDRRVTGTGPRGIPEHRLPDGCALWDFQEQAVAAGLRSQIGLWRAPTGSGKSTAALAFASAVNLCTLILVWNSGLFSQWVRRAQVELGLLESEIGIIRGSKMRIRPLTIGMIQTVNKHKAGLRPIFGCVIPDEVQRMAAPSFGGAIDYFPAKYRLGMSASEKRRDRKEFLIYDTFGDVLIDIPEGELIDRGIVLDVEVRVVPTGFAVPSWYKDLDEPEDFDEATAGAEATAREAIRKQKRALAFGQLVEEMAADQDRNRIAIDIAREELHAGERVVMLSHRREHCRRLDADISAHGHRCGLLIGTEENAAQFERTISGLNDGSIRVGAGTYQAFGTGCDVPPVAVGIATTPLANSVDGRPFFGQVRGRLCRTSPKTGKTTARIYYLWDAALYGLRPLYHLRRWNRNVVVRDGESWIPVSDYIRQAREREKQEQADREREKEGLAT